MATLLNARDSLLQAASSRFTGATVAISAGATTSLVIAVGATVANPSSIALQANTNGYTTPSYTWSYRFGTSGSFTALTGSTNTLTFACDSAFLTAAGTNTIIQFKVVVAETSGLVVNGSEYTLAIPILREGASGTAGAAGIRGTRQLYSSNSAYTSTYTYLSNSAGAASYAARATDLIANATTGSTPTTPLSGDTVTFSNPTSGSEYVYTITFDGTYWTTPGQVIDGSLLVTGSVTAAKINGNNLVIRDASGVAILSANDKLDGSVYIKDASVGNVQIGNTIQSETYVANTAGWKIDKLGNIEVSSLTARGNITANIIQAGTGTFSGDITGSTGEFAGTLRAGVVDFTSASGSTTSYTVPGTYTIAVPAGKTSARLTLQAGGGGGGGGNYRYYQNTYTGAGGGGGANAVVSLSGLTAGHVLEVTVGAGGTAGTPRDGIYTSGSNGGSGGLSRVRNQTTNVTYSTVNGGGGGSVAGNTTAGGTSGGTGGIAGSSGYSTSDANFRLGGAGGNSRYGTGGSGGVGRTNVSATSGSGYGSGGGGGGGNGGGGYGSTETGMYAAAGANGQVIIEFYDSNAVVLSSQFNSLVTQLEAHQTWTFDKTGW